MKKILLIVFLIFSNLTYGSECSKLFSTKVRITKENIRLAALYQVFGTNFLRLNSGEEDIVLFNVNFMFQYWRPDIKDSADLYERIQDAYEFYDNDLLMKIRLSIKNLPAIHRRILEKHYGVDLNFQLLHQDITQLVLMIRDVVIKMVQERLYTREFLKELSWYAILDPHYGAKNGKDESKNPGPYAEKLKKQVYEMLWGTRKQSDGGLSILDRMVSDWRDDFYKNYDAIEVLEIETARKQAAYDKWVTDLIEMVEEIVKEEKLKFAWEVARRLRDDHLGVIGVF